MIVCIKLKKGGFMPLSKEEISRRVAKMSNSEKKVVEEILVFMGKNDSGSVPYELVYNAICECVDPDFLEKIGVDAGVVAQVVEDLTPPF